MRILFCCLIGLMLAAAGCGRPLREPDRPAGRPPNFVFILVDDLGWADVHRYGSAFYETPHLDGLAREGMLFTNGYAAAPVCSPTRASILTGRYPARVQITDWIPGRPNRSDQRLLQAEDLDALPLEEVTLAEVLQQAGYATGHIGKWHLGGDGHLPTAQGFDVNVAGGARGAPPTYFHPYERGDYRLEQLAEGGAAGEYLTDRLGEAAAGFIAAHRDRPFFLHLSHFAVHTPLEAPEALVRKYRARADSLPEAYVFGREGSHPVREVQNHATYAAMVESMDRSVGRVLEALETHGLAGQTIVVFTSDNGGLSTAEGWPTANLPLRAGKGWLYEGGLRVPLLVRWPGVAVPGSLSDVPVGSIDFFPTLLDMAGVALPAGLTIDGVSLVPLLRQQNALDRDALYWHYPHYSNQGGTPGGAVRVGDYKLIETYETGRTELYNLRHDPGETKNLAGLLPGKAAALQARLRAWREQVGARLPAPNPDYRAP